VCWWQERGNRVQTAGAKLNKRAEIKTAGLYVRARAHCRHWTHFRRQSGITAGGCLQDSRAQSETERPTSHTPQAGPDDAGLPHR
jgi:hypothetical protein